MSHWDPNRPPVRDTGPGRVLRFTLYGLLLLITAPLWGTAVHAGLQSWLGRAVLAVCAALIVAAIRHRRRRTY